MLDILVEYRGLFLQGFITTSSLFALIVLIGGSLGVLLGILGGRYSKTVSRAVNGLKFFTKIVPVLILLFWMHFPLQSLLGVVINPFWTAVFAFSFVNAIAVAYLTQNGLASLPKSYREIGLTMGMSMRQVVRYIEAPLFLRKSLPDILVTQATMLEYTLLASLISVPELFRTAQSINAMIYDPVSVYSLIVLFFVVLLAPLHCLITYLKKKYAKIHI